MSEEDRYIMPEQPHRSPQDIIRERSKKKYGVKQPLDDEDFEMIEAEVKELVGEATREAWSSEFEHLVSIAKVRHRELYPELDIYEADRLFEGAYFPQRGVKYPKVKPR